MTKNNTDRPYRLGLDLGANSLGWWVLWLDGQKPPQITGLGPGGVRIFPDGRDPQSKSSNAVARRLARGARRRRDRYLKRRARLIEVLIAHGLMPKDEAARQALVSRDPLALRAAAVEREVAPYDIGRALFHLNQRRGFAANRKTSGQDKDAGKIATASKALAARLDETGAKTLGLYFHRRQAGGGTVRARLNGTGAKAAYEFYPTRDLLKAEFAAIWDKQAAFHPGLLTEVARAVIHQVIFHQRPLRRPPVGKCSLSPAEHPDDQAGFRCPWAHPLAQQFRIWSDVRNLAIGAAGQVKRPLTKEQGDRVAHALFQAKELSFDKLRRLLNLAPEVLFNLESERRTGLDGDQTAAVLGAKKYLGKTWASLPPGQRITIVQRLLTEEDETALIAWLVATVPTDPITAQRLAQAPLPDSHCRLGLRAITAILPFLAQGSNYADAARAAGYDHARLPDGVLSPTGLLPYYGEWLADEVVGTGDPNHPPEKRWGRFPNPTVHIGLGQLRRVVNALIRRYGPPTEITVELTRSFRLPPKRLEELELEQAGNQQRKERRREAIEAEGLAVTARNLLKLRLWEELNPKDPFDRHCPYTGEKISLSLLLSDDVEIDHVIPFQDSWDDSAANKVVCLRPANRYKGKRTPFEAFGTSADGYDWAAIVTQARSLPRNTRWRFDPDAHDRFKAEGGFQGRQLNETGWLARVAKHYLAAVTDPYKIHVLPGRLTALIRGKWGLNSLLTADPDSPAAKNRHDHRHHAIDALIAACTDRALLDRMNTAYEEERQRIVVPEPWGTFRAEVARALDAIIVSHKPEHGLSDRLHEDTAYGLVKEPDKEGGNLVYRKPITGLTEKEVERIRDPHLRQQLRDHIAGEKMRGAKLSEALDSFRNAHGVRHIRLLKSEQPDYLVMISKDGGAPYKAYSAGANAFVDLFETRDGRWLGEAASVFAVNQQGYHPRWPGVYPGARLVMRIFKGDLIALTRDRKREVMVVRQLDASGNRFKLVAHNEAGNLQQRHEDPDDSFRWLMASYSTLKAMGAEAVRVDEIGRLWRLHPKKG